MAQKTVTHTTKPCIGCGERTDLQIPRDRAARWIAGELVQTVFWDWDADQRELLISGTHAACWSRMFGDDS